MEFLSDKLLVNAISVDTFKNGLITLLVWPFGRIQTNVAGYPPPQNWVDFRQWSDSIPKRRYEESITGWKNLLSEPLEGTNNTVSIKEAKSPWPMIRNSRPQEAYLTQVATH